MEHVQSVASHSSRSSSLPPLLHSASKSKAGVDLSSSLWWIDQADSSRPWGQRPKSWRIGQLSEANWELDCPNLKQKGLRPPRAPSRCGNRSTMTSQQKPRKSKVDWVPLNALKAVYLSSTDMSDMESLALSATARSETETSAQQALAAVATLRTGHDAINFFTKYGSMAPIKSVYCNRPPLAEAEACSPYDLVVVPKERAHEEHYTISLSGIMHVCPGQLSEFIPLSEWMQQSTLYRVLTSMAFFKQFPRRKAFMQWQESARHAVFCRRRQSVMRHCFFAKPGFVGPLMEVRKFAQELENVKVLALPQRGCHLSEFVEMQHWGRSSTCGVQHEFEMRHESAVRVLERLLTSVNKQCEAVQESATIKSFKTTGSKSKSLVQEQQETRQRVRRTQIAQQDVAKFRDFVRLADYMFQASRLTNFRSAANELCKGISPDQPCKMFTVSVRFGLEQDVVLDPAKTEFLQTFSELWDNMVAVVSTSPQFADAPGFRALVDTSQRSDIKDILKNDRIYLEQRHRTQETILQLLQEAQEYVTDTYEPYRTIFDFGRTWDEASYSQTAHTYEELVNDMTQMQSFNEHLTRIRTSKLIGVLFVDAKGLRDSLSRIPETALAVMMRMLTSMARQKCTTTAQRFDTFNKALGDFPDVKGTVHASEAEKYAKHYQAALDEQSSLEESVEEVHNMYRLLRAHNVRVPMDDQLSFDMMQTQENTFTNRRMLEARLFIERHLRDLVVVVEALPKAEVASSSSIGDTNVVRVSCTTMGGNELAEVQVNISNELAMLRAQLVEQLDVQECQLRLVMPDGQFLTQADDTTPLSDLFNLINAGAVQEPGA